MSPHSRRDRGIVLVMVLFFVLLLSASIATFLRRVAVDASIAQNRDRTQQALALARGGIRIGETLLLEDLREQGAQGDPDSMHSLWARAGAVDLVDDPDVHLHVRIEDAGARIDLNGFLDKGQVSEANRQFLQQFLAGVIAGMPGRPEDHRYDPAQLAANLADWIDADSVGQDGAPEDDLYQQRSPPYGTPNRPLLSVDELRLVDGFDGPLVEALRPYVGVYPLVGGGGVNLNTAPPWVLAQILRGTEVSGLHPIEPEDVQRIVKARQDGLVCGGSATAAGCTPLSEIFGTDTIEPAPTEHSSVFRVTAIARVVDVEKRIEAVIDRSDPSNLQRLSWRVE
jgi:type II secretory pathway component PulK